MFYVTAAEECGEILFYLTFVTVVFFLYVGFNLYKNMKRRIVMVPIPYTVGDT